MIQNFNYFLCIIISIPCAIWTRTRGFSFILLGPIAGSVSNVSWISGWRRCSKIGRLCPCARCSKRGKTFFQHLDFIFFLVKLLLITLWRWWNVERNVTTFLLTSQRCSSHSDWHVVVLTSVRISWSQERKEKIIINEIWILQEESLN